jgi:hypothetical protein
MPSAQQFQGMLASVVQSQDQEVILGKQAVLSEHGREVRAAISAFPPEVSRALMSEYREPSPQLVNGIESAIMSRELAIENAEKGVGLDQEWASGGGSGRHLNENDAGAVDPWNEPNV